MNCLDCSRLREELRRSKLETIMARKAAAVSERALHLARRENTALRQDAARSLTEALERKRK
jgi:hypothetical protein